MHDLEDGAILGLAESVCADRTGREYSGPIEPDEIVETDGMRYGTDRDPVMGAAATWIRAQSEVLDQAMIET